MATRALASPCPTDEFWTGRSSTRPTNASESAKNTWYHGRRGHTHTHIYIHIYIYFLTLIGTTHNYSYTHMYNVKPGLINPKRLFNWEGTIEVSNHDIGGIPPN